MLLNNSYISPPGNFTLNCRYTDCFDLKNAVGPSVTNNTVNNTIHNACKHRQHM